MGDESGAADQSFRYAGGIAERLEASVSRRVDMVSALEDDHDGIGSVVMQSSQGRPYEARTSAVGIVEDEEDIMFA